MTEVSRIFDPNFPSGLAPGWGHRAVFHLRPKTLFADRLAHGIERAWEAISLAAAVLEDPQPEVAGPIARRAIELSIDLEWLEANTPEVIHPDEVALIAWGLEIVMAAADEAREAFEPAMLALDEQIRGNFDLLRRLNSDDLEAVRTIREAWAGNIESLTAGEADDTPRGLVAQMRETVQILDQVLA